MMMPSRGLQTVSSRAPRLFQAQCRNLSSASRLPSARSLRPSNNAIRPIQWQSSTRPVAALTIASISSVRYASTTPTPAVSTPITSTPTAPTTPPPTPNIDTITLDDVTATIAAADAPAIPDGVLGHLHAVGLDYGIGPTTMIEWVMEHFHVWGGLPWWGAIAATAVVFRVVTFPLYLKAADANARQAALAPVTAPIAARMSAMQKAGDSQGVMKAYQEMNAIRTRAGLSYMNQFLPAVVQSVVGYCGFKLTRAMASLPVPGLQDGGFAWITDLTVSDGYLILPAAMAISTHLLVRFGGETGNANSEHIAPAMKTFMRIGMPSLIFLFTGWQAAATGIWFAASGALAMGQALLLQRPAVREFLRIAPLYRATKAEAIAANPLRSVLEGYSAQRQSKVVDTTATVKSAASMKPTYQAPKLHTSPTASGPTKRGASSVASSRPGVPRTASSSPRQSSKAASESLPTVEEPSPSDTSILTTIKNKIMEHPRSIAQSVRDKLEEQRIKQKADATKRLAEDYERRARERPGSGRR